MWLLFHGLIALLITFIYGETLLNCIPTGMNLVSDPTAAYLFNSLNLAEGLTPRHVDHPGTTVQLIGALIIRLIWLFRAGGQNDLESDFILNLALYEGAISWCLLGLFAAAQLITIIVTFQRKQPWVPALLLVWPLLVNDYYIFFTLNAESGLLIFAQLALCLVYRQLYRPFAKFELWAAILLALGVASKILFLVWLPVLFCLSRRRLKLACLTMLGLLILLAPIAPQIHHSLGFYFDMMTKGGLYGIGEGDDSVGRTMLGNLPNLFEEFASPMALLGFAIAVCLVRFKHLRNSQPPGGASRFTYWRRRLADHRSRRILGLTMVSVASVAFALIITLRQWENRYLVSATAILMLAIALTPNLMLWAKLRIQRGYGCLVFILLALSLVPTWLGARQFSQKFNRQLMANQRLLDLTLTKYADHLKLYGSLYMSGPHPLIVGEFGDYYSSPYEGHSQRRTKTDLRRKMTLHRLFPDTVRLELSSDTAFFPDGERDLAGIITSIPPDRPIVVGLPVAMPEIYLPGLTLIQQECSYNYALYLTVPDSRLGKPIRIDLLNVDASSTAADGGSALALTDKRDDTGWRSEAEEKPRILIELPRGATLAALTYYPPSDFPGPGLIMKYAVYFTNDPEEWGQPVVKGGWEWSRNRPRHILLPPRSPRYLIFEMQSFVGDRAAVNELVIRAFPSRRRR